MLRLVLLSKIIIIWVGTLQVAAAAVTEQGLFIICLFNDAGEKGVGNGGRRRVHH